MAKTFDNNDRKGLTESPCDDASRYTDGTLRLCLEEIDGQAREAKAMARQARQAGWKEVARRTMQYRNGLLHAKSILLKHTKEKACSAGSTTLTSMPSV